MRDLDLIEMRAVFGHVQVSNVARSHLARRAPASYVLSRNSYKLSSGDSARRTSSYIRMNSESCAFQPAPSGRTGCFSWRGVRPSIKEKTPAPPPPPPPGSAPPPPPWGKRPGPLFPLWGGGGSR